MKAKIYGKMIEISDGRLAKGRRGGAEANTQTPEMETAGDQNSRSLNPSYRDGLVNNNSAGSNPAPSPLPGWPKPTDKWNWSFCQFLDLERQAGRIKWFWYEPFSFWLVLPDRSKGERGVRHKVDFMIWYPDGMERRIQMVEVKGHSRNFRDGITRFKMARDKYPCFDWVIVKRRGHGWEEICL